MMPHSTLHSDALWRPASLGWCILGGQAIALALSMAPGVSGSRLIWFGLNSMVILWIVLATSSTLYLARHQLDRLPRTAAILAAIAILTIASMASVAALWALFFQALADTGLLPLMAQTGSLALLTGLVAAAALQNHLRQRELAVLASQAQLQALQARIRPHFLFNTLNSAVSMARSDPARTENLLMDMADLFRSALSPDRQVPLREELDLCRRYLAIEQARFGERLQSHWALPEPLPDTPVPPLCLQPLVENAVHHGVERAHSPSLIQISGQHDGDCLQLTVSSPVHPGTSPRQGHGVGLSSVRTRLADFHPESRLDTWQADGHFHARLHLPLSPQAQVTTR